MTLMCCVGARSCISETHPRLVTAMEPNKTAIERAFELAELFCIRMLATSKPG